MKNPKSWFSHAYRRNVIDMHISADDDRFMAEFDSQAYVEMLCRSKVEATVLYAHSHSGLCYYPTRIGQIHPGLHGRDLLGEVSDLCQQQGIHVVVYYSLIFDTWAYRTHPDWKICDTQGKPAAENSRYGICCPNSPYRDHVQAFITEICENYSFDGMRFDMTFWPSVCYCGFCQERFEMETGRKPPTIIDWSDPHWTAFQRARERWLVEFAALATKTVRQHKPGASVEHQASTYPLTWRMGVTTALALENDFLQGDFYGDALQGSFVRKLLYNLSPNRPSGFETSIALDLSNYTALKPLELLQCKAAAALADQCAFIMIDSIAPSGILNPQVYEKQALVFENMRPYQPFLSGEAVQDIAVYMSLESKFDPAENHHSVDDPAVSNRMPHVEAVLGVCKSLRENHIPFGVITRQNLDDLQRYKAIVLPNILMMDMIEANALREYVKQGGCLYASQYTGLQTPDGRHPENFLLADVFGVSYAGETQEHFTYIAPSQAGTEFFDDYTADFPVGFPTTQILAEGQAGSIMLGELVLPYTDPADPHHFASIHNNPPGKWTSRPALVLNQFYAGKALYAAVALEQFTHSQGLFKNLIQHLAGPFSFETDAPKAVELTLFKQADECRYILNLVNFQNELPNIPVNDISIRLRMGNQSIRQINMLPDQTPIEFEVRYEQVESMVVFSLPRLENFQMIALSY